MKPAFSFFARACLTAQLLVSCNADNSASTATKAHAGMSHSNMVVNSPQLTAMNDMMGRMDAVATTGNTDHDFAQMMLAHHRGAVVMADMELRDGKDAVMRQLATAIKAAQQQEIEELEQSANRLRAASANYRPQDPADPFTAQLKASMEGMMKNMPPVVNDADLDFNGLMRVHHQSAVDMAQAELAHGRDAKLRAMAQRIITAQQAEIQQLIDWRARKAGNTNASTLRYECPMYCAGSESAEPGEYPPYDRRLAEKA
ncbi:DUF305 domain-containing protein [Hymenobacter lucidus]|uniref:DUF305 domain-containing protein n=1 Tax=Hymenobacter lucidus TaxID=2880930 RepID=A0ABS8AYY7_9BACT|nr:DUF305 domain-containing protein [Hymenobacter lucidus]MCB2410984.1 DUF305 domain-containing protein [Hymenobacter lucidus]